MTQALAAPRTWVSVVVDPLTSAQPVRGRSGTRDWNASIWGLLVTFFFTNDQQLISPNECVCPANCCLKIWPALFFVRRFRIRVGHASRNGNKLWNVFFFNKMLSGLTAKQRIRYLKKIINTKEHKLT